LSPIRVGDVLHLISLLQYFVTVWWTQNWDGTDPGPV